MPPFEISPIDIVFLVIPFVLGFYFYWRSAKSEIDKDKIILFFLSILSFAFWIFYLYKMIYPAIDLFFI